MKSILPMLLAAPLLLAACANTAPDGTDVTGDAEVTNPDGTTSVDTCGAAAYAGLVGQTNPAITVPAGTPYRSYRTGDPVTMDFSLKRLNFEHDAKGRLVRVSCG